MRSIPCLLRGFAVASSCALALAQGEAKDIKSKDPLKRVAAVAALEAQGGPEAEKALVSALLDRDWEVVEASALALRKVGTKIALAQLVKVALDGPAWRIRRAAAQALAQIDPVSATEDLAKQTAGKNALHAWLALAIVAPKAKGESADVLARNLRKAQKSKETAEQVAGAGGIAVTTQEVLLEALDGYLSGTDIALAAAALRSVASKPDAAVLPLLQKALCAAKLDDVLERRLIATVAACASTLGSDALKPLQDAVCGSTDANVAARGMRLCEALGRVEGDSAVALAASAGAALEKGLAHADAKVRAAAVHAGVRVKNAAVLLKARDLAASDRDAHVRRVALRDLCDAVEVGADSEKAVFDLVVERLKGDSDARVREEAAVVLARVPTDLSAVALAAALTDREWAVAVCAAVSLGKTTRERGLEALLTMAKDADWKRRGAAVTGLCHLCVHEAVPAIITAMSDTEPAIAKTARVYLKSLIQKELGDDPTAWRKWWDENGARIKMWTPEELKTRREKYGYAKTASEVFKNLDVVVLDSRGDHIQRLLTHEKVVFRSTSAAHIKADALTASTVYVSNCTGEVENDDIEHIAWFVRTGGYLFGSCWSLHETIEKACPGVVRKFETKGEVLDTVDAEPCAPSSAYLKGVFDGGVEPQYNLEGAHLIELLDRESCEVLVDSAPCATRWGIGNLAVWFRYGHGLVLDSVNHFDNQGLTNATFLKEDAERQAYAVDRMGMPYEEWRATRDEKWWSSNTKAAERVFDRTALSLVINFVRSKRMEEL